MLTAPGLSIYEYNNNLDQNALGKYPSSTKNEAVGVTSLKNTAALTKHLQDLAEMGTELHKIAKD